MSRTRIVGGKYTKLTKETHYMFSDENISTFSSKKIQEKGEEDGIFHGTSNEYEPWKNKDIYSRYIGYLCYSVNSKKSLPEEFGIDKNVNTFLTGICSAIKFEAYDINDSSEFPYENWLYIFNILLDNKGEIKDVIVSNYNYKANLQSGIERKLKNINKSNYSTVSKGKELHDEILLDKKLYLKNYTREIDYTGDLSQDKFYNRMAAYAEEASRFNRKMDFSYSFGVANKETENLITDIAGNVAANDYPLIDELIKNKKVLILKEVQSFFGYIFDDLLGAKSFVKSLDSFRGPFLLEPILVTRNNAGNIAEFKDENSDYIKQDIELLNIDLNK